MKLGILDRLTYKFHRLSIPYEVFDTYHKLCQAIFQMSSWTIEKRELTEGIEPKISQTYTSHVHQYSAQLVLCDIHLPADLTFQL